MKKKLNYREQLLGLANIYDVKEIKEYVKSKKNLTSGQLELILRKNNITIPKDFKTSFVKENFIKPISKFKYSISEFRDETTKSKNRYKRKIENFGHDTNRKINTSLKKLWSNIGNVGINFLNIIPKVGNTVYNFFGKVLTNLFNGIYNQQINPRSGRNVIIGFFVIAGITTAIVTITSEVPNAKIVEKIEEKKLETKLKPEVKLKLEVKLKPKVNIKKETKNKI